jgi:hypothetical protein
MDVSGAVDLRGNSLRCCALRQVERTGKCNSKPKVNKPD